jgi:hypothetical protein
MNYFLINNGMINGQSADGSGVFLPAENNGTPEWAAYLAWLAEGNTPLPAPVPEPVPALTTEQKLEAAGLTVTELRELFGLPAPE